MQNKELSRYNKNIIWAYENGYCVEANGDVFSPFGKKLKLLERKREGKTSYFTFSIREKTIPVHRLQAYAKFGEEIFEPGVEIRHLNNNSLDNSWENIGIGTKKDNAQDRPKEQRVALAKYASSFNSKLTDDDRNTIVNDYQNLSDQEVAKIYGVTRQRISQIRKKISS